MGMRAIGIGMDSDLEICVRCMRALERLYLLIRRVLGRRSLLGLLLVSTRSLNTLVIALLTPLLKAVSHFDVPVHT